MDQETLDDFFTSQPLCNDTVTIPVGVLVAHLGSRQASNRGCSGECEGFAGIVIPLSVEKKTVDIPQKDRDKILEEACKLWDQVKAKHLDAYKAAAKRRADLHCLSTSGDRECKCDGEYRDKTIVEDLSLRVGEEQIFVMSAAYCGLRYVGTCKK